MTKEEKEKLKVWLTRVIVIAGIEDGVDAIVERWDAELEKAKREAVIAFTEETVAAMNAIRKG